MQPNRPSFALPLVAALTFLFAPVVARAQWLTQSIALKAGWNAVYLNVDASYDTLDDLVAADNSNPIQEVWLWSPPSGSSQNVQNPQQPTPTSQWISWVRGQGPLSGLQKAIGNQAYLVRSTVDYTWNLKGKPLAPHYQWTSSGLNFIGFPTVPTNPPTFDQFLSQASQFEDGAQIYYYPGGDLGPGNPAQLFNLVGAPLNRGQAVWIRSSAFNSYFGPFNVVLGSASAINYSDSISQFSFRLQNETPNPLTVNLSFSPSEVSPANQLPVLGTPRLLLRGAMNPTTLAYGFTVLSNGVSYTLPPQGQPGSDQEIILGLDRSSMVTNAPGDLLAGILRITDALNLTEIDVGVSATKASTVGLWVGTAVASQINQYLTTYYSATTTDAMNGILASLNLTNGVTGNYSIDPNTGRIVNLTGTNGAYLVKGVNTNPGGVQRPFNLRLIAFNGSTGTAAAADTNTLGVTLLQRAFVGFDTASNQIVSISQGLINPGQLAASRRISAAHLPWTPGNTGWSMPGGNLDLGANLTFNVSEDYTDQASNPFLHTYHPDHNNLTPAYDAVLGPGVESYSIRRTIRLFVNPPPNDFASLTAYGATLQGSYSETITLAGAPGQSRSFDVSGAFKLNKITSNPVLVTH